MILYGSLNSPFVRHCRIVCELVGAQWEFKETSVADASEHTPTLKVPYLEDGDVKLTDSSAIIKYVREKHDQPFLASIEAFELFCLVNTALDSTINLFLLEKNDGITLKESTYLARQQTRVDKILNDLENRDYKIQEPYSDDLIRLACYLEWGNFRKRFNTVGYPNLEKILEHFKALPSFMKTAPGQS